MKPSTLATVTLASCATGIGWALAKVLAVPDHETGDPPTLTDELAERRRQRAMALHPAHSNAASCNVVPLRTPDPAS
jgi:hypothetical protein